MTHLGLRGVLKKSFGDSITDDKADEYARDYSCDGCYEPMFTGRSEFKFAYIFLLKVCVFFRNCS